MPMGPNAVWLEQFATRLLQADPTTTPLDAVRLAVQTYPAAVGLDPGEAAAAFASREHAGRGKPPPSIDRTRAASFGRDRSISGA